MRYQTLLNSLGKPRLKVLLLSALILGSLGLTNCNPQTSVLDSAQPTTTPLTMAQSSSISISANGVLLPKSQLLLSFGAGGLVDSVFVGLGDRVQAGQTLAQLDTASAQIEVMKAESQLRTAEQHYTLVTANLPKEQQAAMAAAQLELMSAQQALETLYTNADSTRAAAFNEMVTANQTVGQAKYQLYYFTIPSTLEGNNPMEAFELAKEQLDQARADYKPYNNQQDQQVPRLNRNPNPRDEYQRRLKDILEGAQRDYNAALHWLELEAALADAQVRLADAELEYEQLQNGPDPDELALAEAQVANAQAQLDLVSDESSTTEQLFLAQSQIESALAELETAQTHLDQLTLRAPSNGVISAIHIAEGEWVVPGAVVLEMLDLSSWLVETKNVGELQIGQIKTGQGAQVRFNAFQGEIVPGKVIAISPQAVVQQGDTTYTLVITLESTDLNLRPGMTARVEILIE